VQRVRKASEASKKEERMSDQDEVLAKWERARKASEASKKEERMSDQDGVLAKWERAGEDALVQVCNAQVTAATYQLACCKLTDAKNLIGQISAYWRPQKAAAHRTWALTCEAERNMLAPVEKARDLWHQKIGEYRREEEKRRREKEARLQAAAEEKARKERERLAKRAEAARAKGKEEKAEALEVEAEVVQAPLVLVPKTEEPKGLTVRKVWKVEVHDVQALAQAAGEHERYAGFLKPHLAAIQRYVTATNGRDVPPGVRATQKEQFAKKRKPSQETW
jgi:hypothetical protein